MFSTPKKVIKHIKKYPTTYLVAGGIVVGYVIGRKAGLKIQAETTESLWNAINYLAVQLNDEYEGTTVTAIIHEALSDS